MATKKAPSLTTPGRVVYLFTQAAERNLQRGMGAKDAATKAQQWIVDCFVDFFQKEDEKDEPTDESMEALIAEVVAAREAFQSKHAAPSLETLKRRFAAEGSLLIRAEACLREIRAAQLHAVDRQPLVDFIHGQVETHFRKGVYGLEGINEANARAANWMKRRLHQHAHRQEA